MPYSFYVIKNEAFADLSVSQLISEEVDRMFPAIKESSVYKGKLFGLPVSSWGEVLFYNREILEENNIKIGENIGWDRLSGHLDEAGGRINLAANRYRVRQLLIEKYVINYTDILNDVDFNTPTFKETLKIMKRIENRITHTTFIMDVNASIRDKAFSIGTYTTSEPTAETNFISIPDIRPDENEKSPMTIKWYVVNPMSKNKELAMKYLEEHIKQGVIYHVSVQVLYENHRLYEGFNEAWLDSMNTVMKNSCVSYQFNIYNEVLGILEKYLGGEITEDSAAEQINAKVQMIISE
jgi:maltose-binding protein MalE